MDEEDEVFVRSLRSHYLKSLENGNPDYKVLEYLTEREKRKLKELELSNTNGVEGTEFSNEKLVCKLHFNVHYE
jgi:hypothetical protein